VSAYQHIATFDGPVAPLWANYALGLLLMDSDPEGATTALEKVVGVDGSDLVRAEAWRLLADLSEDADWARDAYIKAANLGTGRVKSYSLLMIAWFGYSAGEYSAAAELAGRAFCKVGIADHREPAAWLVVHSLAGKKDWSGSALTRVADPECSAELLGELGRWAVDAGHLDEAAIALRSALAAVGKGDLADTWRELLKDSEERLAGKKDEVPARWLKRVTRYCLAPAVARDAEYKGGTVQIKADHTAAEAIKIEVAIAAGEGRALEMVEACLEGTIPQPRGRYRSFEVIIELKDY
jgi:hypothetical protein